MLLQSWNRSTVLDSLHEIQTRLNRSHNKGWTVHMTGTSRLYYCNQETRTASWLPPADIWFSDLPYGWEQALDSERRPYFINHISKTTTYYDPRIEWEEELHPKPRTVELSRDPEVGFGFVAGGEKPVVVRFVTESGPSEGKLLPGDQILNVNNENVQESPKDHVIQLVRRCKDSVKLTVCQPPLDNSTRKSALLSSAKKAKLKSNPSRVRFAEGVVVNGSPLYPTSTLFSGGDASSVPLIPNILKVFLENGQTKSFKYDCNTKVKDVVLSLKNKLCIQRIQHFALVLEQVKSLRRNKLMLLNPEHTIVQIASRPGIRNIRCLFRVAFVPKDACDLAQQDLTAFEYLYLQCCNDVVHERYAPELKYDTALRLAALHIHQHAISNNIPYNKVTVKLIEKEFGLDKFVPVSLMESMKRKELRKLLTHLLKLNQTITGTAHKTLTSLQAKLYYLKIISELPSYGAKCFSTGIRECNVETVILVSPKLGISQIVGIRSSMPMPIATIEQLEGIKVQMKDQISCLVTLYIPSAIHKELNFTMEDRDAEEFVLVLQGYYALLANSELSVEFGKDIWIQESAPSYHSSHAVLFAPWSYIPNVNLEHEKYIDFTSNPLFTFPSDNLNINPAKVSNNGTLCKPSQIKYSQNDTQKKFYKMYADQNGYLVNKSRKQTHTSSVDFQSVIPMEILETDDSYLDACNHEVIKRVTELQELVENSEHYLILHHRDSSDSDGSHISSVDSDPSVPPPGQLKHSDSLTLLAQCHSNVNERLHEAIKALQLADMESDTDSISTPSNSPSRTNANNIRDSNWSFGLHSPDNVLSKKQQGVQDCWKKFQDERVGDLMSTFDADLFGYVESDFIDLTLIPPPQHQPPSPSCTMESMNVEDVELKESEAPPPPLFQDEDTFSPLIVQRLEHDALLDSFLATMTVPPPTLNFINSNVLTSTQISSFIIPPPPANQVKTVLSNEHPKYNDHNLPSKEETLTITKPNINCWEVGGTEDVSLDSATLRKKKIAPPKLPPRTDSLNSLKHTPPNIFSLESKAAIEDVLKLIEENKRIASECAVAQSHGGGSNINEQKFQEVIQELSLETRKLVISSKSLIKSYMEVTNDFSIHLNGCIKQLTTLTYLSRRLVTHTASPLQTKNLILKVLDVVDSFHNCITTTSTEVEVITKYAENLAKVLATLLRSLRIFSP